MIKIRGISVWFASVLFFTKKSHHAKVSPMLSFFICILLAFIIYLLTIEVKMKTSIKNLKFLPDVSFALYYCCVFRLYLNSLMLKVGNTRYTQLSLEKVF